MENKELSLSRSVHDLCKDHPALAQTLAELGFTDITKPGMLQSVGRFMTIPKGAAMKKLPLADITAALRARGYDVQDE